MKILSTQKGSRVSEAEYLLYTHKLCGKCGATKSVNQFYKKLTKTARGWFWDTQCIECRREYCRQYGSNNKERRNARLREWRKKNPDAARRNDRLGKIKSKYGLSEKDEKDLRERHGGKCAICSKPSPRLFIDHCHTTGKVRSLLCPTCNTFLGWYEKKADQIVQFQKYLDKHG